MTKGNRSLGGVEMSYTVQAFVQPPLESHHSSVDTRAARFQRFSHKVKEWDRVGARIGGRFFWGHQRKKSKVKQGTVCLSIWPQSGFSNLEYTVESWAVLAAK